MKKTFIIFIILIFLSQIGLSQAIFNYGIETDLSICQFPQKDSYIVEKTNLLYSPIVGFNRQLTIISNLQLILGLQYQITGTRYYHRYDVREPNDPTVPAFLICTYENWEQQTVHKLCLPFTVGFSFKISKIQPSLFIGFKPNLFLRKKLLSKLVSDAIVNSLDYKYKEEFNILNPKQKQLCH